VKGDVVEIANVGIRGESQRSTADATAVDGGTAGFGEPFDGL
jgi:hypothetical protein